MPSNPVIQAQEPSNRRWLKILLYGFLASATLFLSIACFASIAGAPLGFVSLGLFTSIAAKLALTVGLTSLGLGFAGLSTWLWMKTISKLRATITENTTTQESKKMRPLLEAQIESLRLLKADLMKVPNQDVTAAIQQAYRRDLSEVVTGPIFKMVMDYGDLLYEQFELKEIIYAASNEFFKPLYDELVAYHQYLSELIEPATPAIFHLTLENINQVEDDYKLAIWLSLLNRSGFKIIDASHISLEQAERILPWIEGLLMLSEQGKGSYPSIQLPAFILQSKEARCKAIIQRTQSLAISTSAAELLPYLGNQKDGLHLNNWIPGAISEELVGLQLDVSYKIITKILPQIADGQAIRQAELKPIAIFNQSMAEYNKSACMLLGGSHFYLLEIENYINRPQQLEVLSPVLVFWGFTHLNLSRTPEPQGVAQSASMIALIIGLMQYFEKHRILLKLNPPLWFSSDVKNAALVRKIEAFNVSVDEIREAPARELREKELARNKGLQLMVVSQPKAVPASAPQATRLGAWYTQIKQKINEVTSRSIGRFTLGYQRAVLLESRARMLFALGILSEAVAADDERFLAMAKTIERKDVEARKRELMLIFHPDRKKANIPESTQKETEQEELINRYYKLYGKDAAIKLTAIYSIAQKTYNNPEDFTIEEVDELALESTKLFEEYVEKICAYYDAKTAATERRIAESYQKREQIRKEREQIRKETEQISKQNAEFAFYGKLAYFGVFWRQLAANSNCQFAAVEKDLEQVNHNIKGDNAVILRAKAVAHIRENRTRFEQLLTNDTNAGLTHQDMAYKSLDAYLEKLEQAGTYGDLLSLQALAEVLMRPIVVLQPTGRLEDPVTLQVLHHTKGAQFNMSHALILIFDGKDQYDFAYKYRGNAALRRLIHRALPATPDSSATKIKAVFRGYVVRKELAKNTKKAETAPVKIMEAKL